MELSTRGDRKSRRTVSSPVERVFTSMPNAELVRAHEAGSRPGRRREVVSEDEETTVFWVTNVSPALLVRDDTMPFCRGGQPGEHGFRFQVEREGRSRPEVGIDPAAGPIHDERLGAIRDSDERRMAWSGSAVGGESENLDLVLVRLGDPDLVCWRDIADVVGTRSELRSGHDLPCRRVHNAKSSARTVGHVEVALSLTDRRDPLAVAAFVSSARRETADRGHARSSGIHEVEVAGSPARHENQVERSRKL